MDVPRLEREHYSRSPDLDDPNQLVSFGASGHRGSPLVGAFTEAHILAITQAICDYRMMEQLDGLLYVGKNTHALSGPAQQTALEVLAANAMEVVAQQDDGVTPTPVISRRILVYNSCRKQHLADGIVIRPSHNPPEYGGFRYNGANGGPADTDVTRWIDGHLNALLRNGNTAVKRIRFVKAIRAETTHEEDFVMPYVRDLKNVLEMDAIRPTGLKLAVEAPPGLTGNQSTPFSDWTSPSSIRAPIPLSPL